MNTELDFSLFRKAAERFQTYLSKEQNDKIILSGKYGSGKTTFLKHFFETPRELGIQDHDYEFIRISPVNYSVADFNKDIIELIKYDIIIQFLIKDIPITTADIPSYYFLSEKDIRSIFTTLVSLINIKGIALSKVWDRLKDLKTTLDEKKKVADEGDVFSTFLDQLQNTSGIFERDIVTKTIARVLKRLEERGKIPVLVIDDFDRLDPDHTFRILNIFSSHFDDALFYQSGLKNKFGFHKVILVCDYQNIRSLFYRRYGGEADFSGYIDKFYSSAVFEFDIKKEVRGFVLDILFKMDPDTIQRHQDSLRYFGRQADELLEASIIYGILSGSIALRNLLKLKSINIERHFDYLDSFLYERGRGSSYSLLLLKVNLFLYGGEEGYIRALEKLYQQRYPMILDSYTLDLILSVERHFNRLPRSEYNIIKTDSHTYQFDQNPDNRASTKDMLVDDTKMKVDAALSLDLMKHFLKRLQQTNISD